MKLDTFIRMVPKNKIFTVTFTKVNGETRVMNCRTGVKKGVNGKGLKYDPIEKGNLIVWDMAKQGYRTIKAATVTQIKMDGDIFDITHQ